MNAIWPKWETVSQKLSISTTVAAQRFLSETNQPGLIVPDVPCMGSAWQVGILLFSGGDKNTSRYNKK